ncbi:SRPBCC family protein [Citricoccus nitrophenolicus]|uniref:SRPBCC family protein n=1 Tax=Citricoccus nitrophenolicus TaxID=863575 RepID=UPI0039B5463A
MSNEPENAPQPAFNPETGLPTSAPQAGWPEPVDTGPLQVSYRIRIQAPAAELYSILANPHRHHEVDGSATVQYAKTGPDLVSVGDEFSVAMKKFGVPYTMTLVVTAADEDELVEWKHPGGHRWRWRFEDQGDGSTVVTETFDYSWTRHVVARGYELTRRPQDNAKGIRASLTRLAGRYL